MSDINYPQRWLSEHKAGKSKVGWYRPKNFEILKSQKGLDDADINVSEVYIIVPDTVDCKDIIPLQLTFLPRIANKLDYELTISDTGLCILNEETNKLEFQGKPGQVTLTLTMTDGGSTNTKTINIKKDASTIHIKEGNTFVQNVERDLSLVLLPDDNTEEVLEVYVWNNKEVEINQTEIPLTYKLISKFVGKFDLKVVTNRKIYKVPFFVVENENMLVTDVSMIVKDSYNFNETIFIQPTFLPPTATLKDYTVLVNDSTIAQWHSGKNAIITKEKNGLTKVTIKMINSVAFFDFDLKVKDEGAVIIVEDIELILPTTLEVENKIMIDVRITPTDATVDDLEITSTEQASIKKENGKWYITGEQIGQGTVTLKSESNNIEKTYTIQVTPILISKIEFSEIPNEMNVGDTHEFTVTVTPINATDKTFTITNSENIICEKVEENIYKITSKSNGDAWIKAISNDNSLIEYTKEFKINNILVTDFEVTEIPQSVFVGEVFDFTVKVLPLNATNQKYNIIASDNLKMNSFEDNKYTYEAIEVGPSSLKIVSDDTNSTKTINIEIKPILVSDITLTSNNTGNLIVDDTPSLLNIIITPENATDKTYSIISSENIELTKKSNNEYEYKAISSTPNTGKITVKANDDSSLEKSTSFNIVDPIVLVNSIDFDLPVETNVSEKINLTDLIIINPDNATNKTYTVSVVSGPGEIDENNVLSFTSSGNVEIKVKANDTSLVEIIKNIAVN